jgi:hypothetical protein
MSSIFKKTHSQASIEALKNSKLSEKSFDYNLAQMIGERIKSRVESILKIAENKNEYRISSLAHYSLTKLVINKYFICVNYYNNETFMLSTVSSIKSIAQQLSAILLNYLTNCFSTIKSDQTSFLSKVANRQAFKILSNFISYLNC